MRKPTQKSPREQELTVYRSCMYIQSSVIVFNNTMGFERQRCLPKITSEPGFIKVERTWSFKVLVSKSSGSGQST